MSQAQTTPQTAPPAVQAAPAASNVIQLRPPARWHDPLQLMQDKAPPKIFRIVLWTLAVLVLLLCIWAAFGKLDIIASAEGKLAAQTLVKVVQPAEAGVLREILVKEGQAVKAGQVLARLDPTVARAERDSVGNVLNEQRLQLRRLQAQLADQSFTLQPGDDKKLYLQVQSQDLAQRRAFSDALAQEQALLQKAESDLAAARQVQQKLEQSLPSYRKAAESYDKLEKEGFMGSLAAAEKQREAQEKAKDLEAQRANVAALQASIAAQQKKIAQLHSNSRADLERELADVRNKIAQLAPNLDKSAYKEGLLELRAPQDGVVKELATTTVGAVLQPGAVLMSLAPQGEALYADVALKNEDVGFVQPGQRAQIKLSAYPFQRYGMLLGKVEYISADASETPKPPASANPQDPASMAAGIATYKARIKLDAQQLHAPQGQVLQLTQGMQVVAEINQGQRTVWQYLLSPVQKTVAEAARER
ncbi:HlyD family type I secretion periplasmic adaptor subunit [Massilia sp. W12]|uniref:HlyD family type I secretion periplasmic adaptor subunit n=1 Tax=Massilia sp. W12 TaxID=3126507 RepID=UPI0030D58B94